MKILYYSTIISVAVLSLCCLVFYVWQVNSLTSGSYIVRNYEKEIASLYAKNAGLETIFAQANFLEQVQEKAIAMSFEKINNIKYIQVVDGTLASAK